MPVPPGAGLFNGTKGVLMYIIAGLGNPGKKYEKTRHNLGFMAIDRLADDIGTSVEKTKFDALTGEAVLNGEKVLLLKPQTFMNESGKSLRKAMDFYKVEPDHLMVIYDDFDIEEGDVRIRPFGSAGTHNGMRSIISELGTSRFPRIRIGTGSGNMEDKDLIGFVLSGFGGESGKKIDEALSTASEAARLFVEKGIDLAMNRCNGRNKNKDE